MLPAQRSIHPVRVRRRSIVTLLAAAACLLVSAGVLTQGIRHRYGYDHQLGLVDLFNLDAEQTPAAFFSASLLLFAGFLNAAIAAMTGITEKGRFRPWAGLAAGFFLMAADESIAMHERLIEPTRKLLSLAHSGPLNYAWVVPGGALAFLIGIFYLKFLSGLPSGTRNGFLLSACVYLSGALGMEMAGGWYASIHGEKGMGFALCVAVEESLEMAGSILFIHSLLSYIEKQFPEVTIQVGE